MRCSLLVLFLPVWLSTSPVAAQTEEYTRLSTAGTAASQAGRHKEAYALFQQAHAAFPNARSLRALGATAFQLGRYRVAIGHYEAALVDQRRPLTPEQRTQAENELGVARRLVGRLRVTVDTADATVTLDDQPLTPRESVIVDPGDHEIVARRAGYEDERRTIATISAQEQVLALTLRASAATAPTTVLVPTTPIEADITRITDVGYLAVGGALLGIGVVGLGGGIGAHAYGQDAINAWNDSVGMGSCRAERPATDPPECLTLYRRYDDSQPWLYVGYIAGGALTVTGILLMVLAPSVPASSSRRATASCGPGPGELGVACRVEL